jgi:hypothetical protein
MVRETLGRREEEERSALVRDMVDVVDGRTQWVEWRFFVDVRGVN